MWAWVYVFLANNEFARGSGVPVKAQQSVNVSEQSISITEYNNHGVQIFNSDKKDTDKQSGVWNGGRFLYDVPNHLLTVQATPSDNRKVVKIKVDDAEPNAFVQFKIEYDGGLGVAIITQHENNAQNFLGGVTRKTQYGVRLNQNKETKMVISIPENSDDTIVRVYALWWEIQTAQ